MEERGRRAEADGEEQVRLDHEWKMSSEEFVKTRKDERKRRESERQALREVVQRISIDFRRGCEGRVVLFEVLFGLNSLNSPFDTRLDSVCASSHSTYPGCTSEQQHRRTSDTAGGASIDSKAEKNRPFSLLIITENYSRETR